MEFVSNNGIWKDSKANEIPTFPIQSNSWDRTIPLCVAEEAYKEYSAQHGTNQSLERLGKRGGFGASELAILLYERCKRLENTEIEGGVLSIAPKRKVLFSQKVNISKEENEE